MFTPPSRQILYITYPEISSFQKYNLAATSKTINTYHHCTRPLPHVIHRHIRPHYNLHISLCATSLNRISLCKPAHSLPLIAFFSAPQYRTYRQWRMLQLLLFTVFPVCSLVLAKTSFNYSI